MNKSKNKILKATHEGALKIGDKDIKCAVLEDGTRILSKTTVFAALDRPPRGDRKIDPVFERDGQIINLPPFLKAKNLSPYIDDDLLQACQPLTYVKKNGKEAKGYVAEILPLVADVWLKAREAEAPLTAAQNLLVKKAEILTRSLAKVGITGLIDEATGYQSVREAEALQQILNKHLTDDWAKWSKTFPDEFYIHLFRLKGMHLEKPNGKKASYVGHWTNSVVYDRLAPGIRSELRRKNPKNEKGNKARKDHQHLTRNFGHPKLKEYLTQVIFLMKTCTKWRDFEDRLSKVYPKYGDNLVLPLLEEE